MQKYDYTETMKNNMKIYEIADIHCGQMNFNVKKLIKTVNHVKSEPNSVIQLGGDLVDAVIPGDKRFCLQNYDGKFKSVSDQLEYVENIFEPVTDRLKTVIIGTHEKSILNTLDVTKKFCSDMGCDDGRYVVTAIFGDIWIQDWHGVGNCNPKGKPEAIKFKEEQWVKNKMCDMNHVHDVMIMHHIHKMRIIPPTKEYIFRNLKNNDMAEIYNKHKMKINGKRYIDADCRWYASSGCYLETYKENSMCYGEINGYSEQELGCVYTEIKNGKLLGVFKYIP